MVLDTIFNDVRFLFYAWRELVMPRQVKSHPVTGRWTPNTFPQRIGAFLWSLLGALVIGAFYPILFVGLVFRRQMKAIDGTVGRLGVITIGALVTIGWAAVGFTSLPVGGTVGAAVSGAIGITLFGIGLLAAKFKLRFVSYPAFINTLLFPPVVLSYFVPSLKEVIFPKTSGIVIWLLNNVFEPIGAADLLSSYFTLEGAAYMLFWFSVSLVVGWTLAALVTLASRVRERSAEARRSQLEG